MDKPLTKYWRYQKERFRWTKEATWLFIQKCLVLEAVVGVATAIGSLFVPLHLGEAIDLSLGAFVRAFLFGIVGAVIVALAALIVNFFLAPYQMYRAEKERADSLQSARSKFPDIAFRSQSGPFIIFDIKDGGLDKRSFTVVFPNVSITNREGNPLALDFTLKLYSSKERFSWLEVTPEREPVSAWEARKAGFNVPKLSVLKTPINLGSHHNDIGYIGFHLFAWEIDHSGFVKLPDNILYGLVIQDLSSEKTAEVVVGSLSKAEMLGASIRQD